ncbi:MAG: ribbon-helix-helix domain-containing protein [Methanomassiliicoccaceae archaeon]|nr:ribbon-helix-helix domain-containing protein [Methanomassiliicoccaceae archaeon]
MGETEVTFSIRMGIEDYQELMDFMSENGIKNRSRFIRDAITERLSSQKLKSGDAGTVGGYFVRFKEVQMEALRLMVEDGTAFDEEEFIRSCVLKRLVSPETEADSADRAFKAAQLASRSK